jgi:hypothetical protein
MTVPSESPEVTAIRLLGEQFAKLTVVKNLDYKDAKFIAWRNTTIDLLQRFLRPNSSHLITFAEIRFRGQGQLQIRRHPFDGYRGPRTKVPHPTNPADRDIFVRGCEIAEECIKGATDEIRNFGIYLEGTRNKPQRERSSVQQNFHGPVVIHNQAIATDNAIQNIGQMGTIGPNLTEIATLFKESMDLTGRERLDGLKAIEVIASETHKDETKRDWKSIVDSGDKILSIASKATDMAIKFAPLLPAITTLIHEAMKRL